MNIRNIALSLSATAIVAFLSLAFIHIGGDWVVARVQQINASAQAATVQP